MSKTNYPQLIAAMPTAEVQALFKTYSGLQSIGVRDVLIRELLAKELDQREQEESTYYGA
jgi:Trp operon repressor